MPTRNEMQRFLDQQRVWLNVIERRETPDRARRQLVALGISLDVAEGMISTALWLQSNRCRLLLDV